MTREKIFDLILAASKPVAWSLFAVLAAVIYRVLRTPLTEKDAADLLFVGLSCLGLIPVFYRFGAYGRRGG